MSVKFNFDSKKLMREIQKNFESEVKKNPSKFLKGHEGEEFSSKCPECGNDTVRIISDGYAQCPKCEHIAKVSVNVHWS